MDDTTHVDDGLGIQKITFSIRILTAAGPRNTIMPRQDLDAALGSNASCGGDGGDSDSRTRATESMGRDGGKWGGYMKKGLQGYGRRSTIDQ
ncbi:hypothetical protein BN1708_012431 [Verticillium longisporum]|uniref:Uncharacterized protein n=1 Tax=Verticillium longisporum TaxID=100787 RepID=A0A0G4LAD9_VERLO|nr:hypothetical protein BN1708_012431 [Verticillium longisporum]